MRIKSIILSLIISLSLFGNALGQICGVSEYPYGFGGINYPRMHGNHFKDIVEDLPFVSEHESRHRYSQFWISTDVLNVRSGPGLEYEVTSETYYGNLVFAFAKRGDWVAIGKGLTYGNVKIKPQWVNIKYLSAHRIENQVDASILKKKCSFNRNSEIDGKELLHDRQNNIYNACNAVRNYLMHQKLLSKDHNYYEEYAAWRNSKKFPENYNSLPCA